MAESATSFAHEQIGRLWLRVCELEWELQRLRGDASASTPAPLRLIKAEQEKE